MLSYLLAALESEEDKRRFTELYEENHVRAEQTALRILRDPHDAEDAVQNAFLQVIHHFDEISEIPCKKLGFWIISIVKNEALMILRRKQKELPQENWDTFSADVSDPTSYNELVHLFSQLPPTYRSALEMRLINGYSGKEITTSYASIDETRAHIEGQIWLPDLRQRDVENYCAGFVYTDESKTTLDHISARYELQGGCVLRFLADYDRTIDLIIDDSNDLQFLECDNRCIYYRQDSSSRTDFYFAYFSENDIYYELMLSVPIGTLSSDDAMGMLFRIASP